ncbi:glycosyltransferase family 2 protein [Dactylosporangium sp. CA-139066]|uniref:glycosyltransferase family 2 protein n=1 Tax=Dactylosporangium sp. CA-139066 TaxID=3239930 RepID=UPI003D8BD11E
MGAARESSGSRTAPVVSIVTVSHNARESLLKGLAALQAGTEVPAELIVVDNGSTDNTAAAVRHAFRGVSLVRREAPLHPLAAANLGAAQAGAPWLLLLDPGLEPVGDAIRTLLEYAGGHPECRLYTGRTMRDGSDDGRTVEGTPTFWGTACVAASLPFDPERLPGLDRAIGGEVPALTPRMLLAERGLWDDLGGFDERLPAADLSVRARAFGARPVLVPDAQMASLTPAPAARRVTIAGLAERMAFAHRHWAPGRARAAGWLLIAAALARSSTGEPWRSAWQDRAWLSTMDTDVPVAAPHLPTQPLRSAPDATQPLRSAPDATQPLRSAPDATPLSKAQP